MTTLVLAPGFGDTPRHWADRLDGIGTLVALEWPGLWGQAPTPTPFTDQVGRIAAATTPDSVTVAHSLGARAALAAAGTAHPVGLVLVAPALGDVSVFAPAALTAWRATGRRPTTRPHPDGGDVTFDVDVAFADDTLAAPPARPVDVPVLLIRLSDDDATHNPTAARFAARLPHAAVVDVDGPHRWWEHPDATDVVRALVAGFVARVAGGTGWAV